MVIYKVLDFKVNQNKSHQRKNFSRAFILLELQE